MDAAPRTLFDKIWSAHVIAPLAQDSALIAIDRVFLHERTGAAALNALAAANRAILDPARVFAVTDHIVDTRPGRDDRTLMPGGQAFITETRAAARAAGIRLFDVNDPEQGIVHVISPEMGIVLPGLTLIAPDSHTCTQGAFGALAWGIGSSEAEHAMATGALRLKKPGVQRVTLAGTPAAGVTPKDMVMALIAQHGAGGGNGCVVEFVGDAVAALDMEGRMTLCNMATEFAAMTGIIAPDDKTVGWLAGRAYAPSGARWDAARQQWEELFSDPGAAFDREYAIDTSELAPMVSWGTSPEHSVPVTGAVPADAHPRVLEYIGLSAGQGVAGVPIDAAFIGSCTNGRLSDLRLAARILRGRRIAPDIKAICVPGSTQVKRAAEAEGLDRVFLDAGFEWRESGCSLCFFAGGEGFGPGQRVMSSTNRNFEGRQGPGVRTHIASPATVAASALAGRIADPRGAL